MSLQEAIEESIRERDRCSVRSLGEFNLAQTDDTTYVEMGIRKGNPEIVTYFTVAATLGVIDETSGGDIQGTIYGEDKVFRWTLSAERRGFAPDTLRQYLLANMRID
jgi:hypothetical protein